MPKEYSAKLTLQDNWGEVIDKAITKTNKLLKEAEKLDKIKINPQVDIKTNKTLMKQVENDLKRLEKSNINIHTKLDSSFKSTVNAIERAVPNKKVVSIVATENVTKTLNNVEREVFTKTNKVNNIIKSSFGSIGSSINGSLGGLNSFVDRLSSASNLMRSFSRATLRSTDGDGANLLSSAIAGGVAGKIAGGFNNKKDTGSNDSSKIRSKINKEKNDFDDWLRAKLNGAPNVAFDKWLTAFDNVAKKIQNNFSNKIGGAFRDTINKAKLNMRGFKIPDNFHSTFSNYGRLIANQKKKLTELGVVNPLKNYRYPTGAERVITNPVTGQKKILFGFIKEQSKVSKVFESIKASASSAGQAIKSRINNGINAIKTSSLYQKVSSTFSSIANKANITGTRIKFAFQRGIYQASATFAKIVIASGNAYSKVKSAFSKLSSAIPGPIQKGVSLAVKAVGNITKATAKISGKIFKFSIKAIDKATGVIKGIANQAMGLAKIGVGALSAGATVGVQGLASRQAQKVSIEHFMGVSNANNGGGLSQEQINTNANAYYDQLQNLANNTPFQNADVSQAGTRMIQIANGDTNFAMDMTKLSADMAALTSGKTVSDASEALYDLASTGDATRLQEFGFKVSQADFKGLVGKGETDDLTPEETAEAFKKLVDGKLKTTFSGGAEKLAQTVGGKFSTITGKFKKGLTDVAEVFGNKMGGGLDKAIGFIDKLFKKDDKGNFSNNFVQGLVDGISSAIKFVGKLFGEIKGLAPKIQNALGPVKDAFSNVFKGVSMDDIVSKIGSTLGRLIDFATPIISAFAGVFETIIPKIMPVIDAVIGAFESLSPAFETVVNMITPVLDFFIGLFEKVATFIKDNSDTINAIMEDLGKIWETVWGAFSTVLEVAWDILSPILEELLDVLGWIVDKISEFMDGIGNVMSWIGDKWNSFSNWISGGDKEESTSSSGSSTTRTTTNTTNNIGESRAVGLDYVSYNGYLARLHVGEKILTRPEANKYRAEQRNGSTSSNKNMNVVINVSGNDSPERVATLVYDKLMQASLNMA